MLTKTDLKSLQCGLTALSKLQRHASEKYHRTGDQMFADQSHDFQYAWDTMYSALEHAGLMSTKGEVIDLA